MDMRYFPLLPLFCACLSGQPPAPPTRNLAITRASDAGIVTIHLRNEYSSPATAWILQCATPGGGSRHYWNDQDLSFQTKPIEPDGEIEFKIVQRPSAIAQRLPEMPDCDDFHVIAAVFGDGTVTGDLRWINAIVAERRSVYHEAGKATEILNTAISKGTSNADVIKQLTDWQVSERPGGMPARPLSTYGPSSGWQSNGTAPPVRRLAGGIAAGAARWLVETQQESLPDAVKALDDWRDRLTKLPAVAETTGPSLPTMSSLPSGPFTPRSEPEMVGKPAPGFTLKDVDGHEFTLASQRGKPVLLSFWATWCGPCRDELPHLKTLYDQFNSKGLTVVSVDTNESAAKARQYFADHSYPFVNLLGSGTGVQKTYGAEGIPRVVLIDKDGIVRFVHTGWGSKMDLTPEVKKLVE